MAALAGQAPVKVRSRDPGTAADLLERALDAYRECGDELGEALVGSRLAHARPPAGAWTEWARALRLHESIGTYGSAELAGLLGDPLADGNA
ncbi:hypothetical protein GCM10009853_014370 [Glycomyces scopariae]